MRSILAKQALQNRIGRTVPSPSTTPRHFIPDLDGRAPGYARRDKPWEGHRWSGAPLPQFLIEGATISNTHQANMNKDHELKISLAWDTIWAPR